MTKKKIIRKGKGKEKKRKKKQFLREIDWRCEFATRYDPRAVHASRATRF